MHALRRVTTPADWAAMHAIRRATLFAPGRRKVDIVYDENHPDDHAEGHVPFVLVDDGEPIGVVRLDFRGDIAIVRLVAILPSLQRRGHGRLLDALVIEEARRRGVKELRLNSAPDAVGFYEKTGWVHGDWDPAELVGIGADCVQMIKAIRGSFKP